MMHTNPRTGITITAATTGPPGTSSSTRTRCTTSSRSSTTRHSRRVRCGEWDNSSSIRTPEDACNPHPQGSGSRVMDLTDAERLLLDFEREWWQLPATKMSEIRTRFGFSASSYYRSLHSLIDRPDAEAYDPLTVRRVRRRREQLRRERIEG